MQLWVYAICFTVIVKDVTGNEGLKQILTIQGVYKFNQANFREIPRWILRKIQDMFALLRPPM